MAARGGIALYLVRLITKWGNLDLSGSVPGGSRSSHDGPTRDPRRRKAPWSRSGTVSPTALVGPRALGDRSAPVAHSRHQQSAGRSECVAASRATSSSTLVRRAVRD